LDKTTLLERVRRARTSLRSGNFTPQGLDQLLADVEAGLQAQEAAGDPVARVMESLSFTEAQAIMLIIGALQGQDGVVVASRVADDAGFTRSVIVTALRKMEAGGLVKTNALGMKGTHIKILVPNLRERLQAAG
jgi:transcriptional pleiotropic repressor